MHLNVREVVPLLGIIRRTREEERRRHVTQRSALVVVSRKLESFAGLP